MPDLPSLAYLMVAIAVAPVFISATGRLRFHWLAAAFICGLIFFGLGTLGGIWNRTGARLVR